MGNCNEFIFQPLKVTSGTSSTNFDASKSRLETFEKMLETVGNLIDNVNLIDDLFTGDEESKPEAKLELVSKVLEKVTKDLEAKHGNVDDIFDNAGIIKLLDELIGELAESYGKEDLEYDTYPPHPEFPTVSLMGLPKMLKGGPPTIFADEKLRRIIKLVIKTKAGFMKTKPRAQKCFEDGEYEKGYEAIFTELSHFKMLSSIPSLTDFIPDPEYVVKHWEEDKEHGRQFLCGVNPVMIKVAKNLGDLSEEIVQKLGKHNLQKYIEQDRLFFVSYDELGELEKNPHSAYPKANNPDIKPPLTNEEWRYFDPAIAVFVLSENREDLVTNAIQLERKPGAKVYTNKEGKNRTEWLYAKARLATSDSNYHEWVSHLGMTHLAAESHIIAAWNTLRQKNHKLYTFLEPLYEDTLVLNWAARKSLASYKALSLGDELSSVGVGQYLQLFLKKWQKYDFFTHSGLPTELESRGFTEDFDMPCYLFREDGMKLWNAYTKFAKDFVDECYASDDDLAMDEVVQEWARETSYADRGAVPGFPTSFTDKATLAKALQTIMWMTSGQHAAINFPQYDFYAYVPNKPLNARASLEAFPSHESEEEQRKWMFENYFPNFECVVDQVGLTKILTLPSTHTIGKLDEQFKDRGAEAYEDFKKELEGIGNEITERNKKNKKKNGPIYHYLHPDVVPASIEI